MNKVFKSGAHFDGDDYQPKRDHKRITGQALRVWEYIKDGKWRTLQSISYTVGSPEASVSACLRAFRQEKFGGLDIQRRYVDKGLYEYRFHDSK